MARKLQFLCDSAEKKPGIPGGNIQWATHTSGARNEVTYTMAADPAGNVYVVGRKGKSSFLIRLIKWIKQFQQTEILNSTELSIV